MKILISGGLGFVGRNVSKYLIENGHEIVIVDNLVKGSGARSLNEMNTSFRQVLRNASIKKIDIRSFPSKRLSDFDSVIHLAAIVGGREMIEKKPLAVAEDLEIDSHIIRLWEQGYFEHLTYLSSSAAYPIKFQRNSGHLLEENDIDFDEDISMPDLTYGWAKLTGEYLINLAKKRSNQMIGCVIRPFSGYGIDQDLAYPFPSIFKRALEFQDRDNFYVWGSGKQERDFIYIDDVARCISEFSCNKYNGVTNLATGVGINFLDLARLLLAAAGKSDVDVIGRSEMPEGVMSRVGDTKNFFSLLQKYNMPIPQSIETIINLNFQEWINFAI